jgi:phosphatidylserine/phosphatidylglycerophosphate/cardiolipin synthase-like enzyme
MSSHTWRLPAGTAGVIALVWLTGCAPSPLFAAGRVLAQVPPLGPAHPVRVGGDDITLLRGGVATFERIRSLIDSAHASIHVEVYEFNRRDLATALVAAEHRGVRVTVVDDPSELSSSGTDARLRVDGVDVVDYPVRKLMIDHVKLLVVDSSVAVVGGINWGAASAANHDYDALVRGPVVHNLDRVFQRDLMTCGRSVAVPEPVPDTALIVASTLPGAEIRPLALDLINSARHSLDLELFDLTDTTVVRALESAHQRGVRIRMLLDPGQPSNLPSAAALREAGVDVRDYRTHGELLHAKAVVADADSILFGSANWSGGGFTRNHEVDIEVPESRTLAAQMEAQMLLDWNASA